MDDGEAFNGLAKTHATSRALCVVSGCCSVVRLPRRTLLEGRESRTTAMLKQHRWPWIGETAKIHTFGGPVAVLRSAFQLCI